MNSKTTDQTPHALGPTFRYSLVPPMDVLLTLREINPPERVRSPSFDPERRLIIACEDIFSGPSPKMRLSKLAELAPADITPELLDDNNAFIPVHPSILALRFSMQTLCEELAPPAVIPEETFSPEPPEPDPEPEPEISPVPSPRAVAQDAPREEPTTAAGEPTPDPQVPPLMPSLPQLKIPKQRRPMGFLPVLRRKKPEPPEAELTEPPEPPKVETASQEEEIPQPEENFAEHQVPVADTTPDPDLEVESPVPEEELQENSAGEEEISADSIPSDDEQAGLPSDEYREPPRTLDVEHMPEEEPALDLACQEKIQEIFLTEESLTLDRVLEECGGLPGIRSCILTKGSSILGSRNVPGSIDLVSLTANAAHMLEGVKSSSMRMGLGSIPAITIHSEKGPVSFFYSGQLVMLVLHADRGFIPGVRERLHEVVQALAAAPLPLSLPFEETEP